MDTEEQSGAEGAEEVHSLEGPLRSRKGHTVRVELTGFFRQEDLDADFFGRLE